MTSNYIETIALLKRVVEIDKELISSYESQIRDMRKELLFAEDANKRLKSQLDKTPKIVKTYGLAVPIESHGSGVVIYA